MKHVYLRYISILRFQDDKTKDKSKKLRNSLPRFIGEATNRNEVEFGEAKSHKAGTKGKM
jgi:hypothetical protein